uniref:O-methyltransferase domain-containing protein n=1 Tax=Araucaria cunninghamii TaxID=56994 RepID=A0A0D6QSF3_ARACU
MTVRTRIRNPAAGEVLASILVNMANGNEGRGALLELAYLCTFPMAARAAVVLKVPEILSSAGGGPLTAKQIADRIPGTTTSEAKLDRLLQALATYGLFAVSDSSPRAYSLSAMSKLLVKEENEDGVSLAPLVLMHTEPSQLEIMRFLHEAVLDDAVVPFEKCYGKPMYAYYGENSAMAELFHSAMSNLSTTVTKAALKSYDGFKDVKVLVDVGGSEGMNCSLVRAVHPHISAINFDMPFVVAKAPPLPGVEHRGGSMFESVPTGGDAILLKTVLHNWDDGACGRILGNCYSALPSTGKMIIIDHLLPEKIDGSSASRLTVSVDLAMMTVFKGGKERTAPQFQHLVESVGFKGFKVAAYGDVLSVMEACKP